MPFQWSHLPRWLAILLIIGFFATAGFAFALFEMVTTPQTWGNFGDVLRVGIFFASLGCILGTAISLDGRSGTPFGDHPKLRTAMCAVFGAVTVLVVWSWSPEGFSSAWAAAGAAVGAILGWFGWRWARYVEHA